MKLPSSIGALPFLLEAVSLGQLRIIQQDVVHGRPHLFPQFTFSLGYESKTLGYLSAPLTPSRL